MAGLVDRLEGVHVGNLVCLSNEQGDKVAGFVKEYTTRDITLSHEFPGNEDRYSEYKFPHVSLGDRTYCLGSFTKCNILDNMTVTQ